MLHALLIAVLMDKLTFVLLHQDTLSYILADILLYVSFSSSELEQVFPKLNNNNNNTRLIISFKSV